MPNAIHHDNSNARSIILNFKQSDFSYYEHDNAFINSFSKIKTQVSFVSSLYLSINTIMIVKLFIICVFANRIFFCQYTHVRQSRDGLKIHFTNFRIWRYRKPTFLLFISQTSLPCLKQYRQCCFENIKTYIFSHRNKFEEYFDRLNQSP